MAITPELPAGFIELTSAAAQSARALLLMIAHTNAYQEWCQVTTWQETCGNLDLFRAEVDQDDAAKGISSPNVVLEMLGENHARIDTDQPVFAGAEFALVISASVPADGQLDLDFLEFCERKSRLMTELTGMVGSDQPGTDHSWPNISELTESGPPVLEYMGSVAFMSCRWTLSTRGPRNG